VGERNVLKYGLNLEGSFRRDGKQVLGNLAFFRNRADPELKLIDRQTALGPRMYFQHDRSGIVKNQLRAEGYFEVRNVLIRPVEQTILPLVDGRLSAGNLSLRNLLSHDFTPASTVPGPGLGEVVVGVEGLIRHGTKRLGGDFLFTRREFSARGELALGWRTRSDLFLRYKRGVGSSTNGTPVFQLHRIGGPANLRGIEEGEYIGRFLAYEQSAIGIGLVTMWRTLGGSATDGGVLAQAYLTAFYDRAALNDARAITNLEHAAHGKGIGVELRNMPAGGRHVNLLIGYARSPQSVLHRRGVMIMDVNFGF
jgi:hypothetical protein